MIVQGCKYLDYSDKYDAKLQALSPWHIFWLRKTPPDLPSMVQFCTKYGRLNSPLACIDKAHAQCLEYEDSAHSIEDERIGDD